MTHAFIDATDQIWLNRESRTGGVLWQIIESNGRIAGTIVTDGKNRLLGSDGEAVWGEVRGQFDVPLLVRWQITK